MINISQISFKYANQSDTQGLKNISLHIDRGEVIVLCGQSGCGKTTLTRLINGLIPHYYPGKLSGSLDIEGKDLLAMSLYDRSQFTGSVFQNPRSQFFNLNTTGELAFTCENMGLPVYEIKQRIEETAKTFHIEKLLDRNIFHLSGGEKQKIACAAVSTAKPDIIILDEPSSNLDPRGVQNLKDTITQWKKEGKTLIIAEHRLFFLENIADRFIYMEKGSIAKIYSTRKHTNEPYASIHNRKELRTNICKTYTCKGVTNKEASPSHPLKSKQPLTLCGDGTSAFSCGHDTRSFSLHNFSCTYNSGKAVLNIKHLTIPENTISAIIGNNGSGKSTLARSICGLEKRCPGYIRYRGKQYGRKERTRTSYLVMQDVNHQLFTESVSKEVLLSMEHQDQQRAQDILTLLDLSEYQDEHPMSLSGGQKQRVAIAGAVASERNIIILDEPTSGLDLKHMRDVSKLIQQLRDMGKTIVIITHDLQLIYECCTNIIHLEKGSVVDTYPLIDKNRYRIDLFFSSQDNKTTDEKVLV